MAAHRPPYHLRTCATDCHPPEYILPLARPAMGPQDAELHCRDLQLAGEPTRQARTLYCRSLPLMSGPSTTVAVAGEAGLAARMANELRRGRGGAGQGSAVGCAAHAAGCRHALVVCGLFLSFFVCGISTGQRMACPSRAHF